MNQKRGRRRNGRAVGIVLLAVLLLCGLLGGCQSSGTGENGTGEEGVKSATFRLTSEEYPRVDGSTATIPLSEAFGAAVMDLTPRQAGQYILHNKTHQAYLNLIAKEKDIIFVTSPSDEELTLAKEAGVTLEVVPVVSEGFVFLANGENPVSNLTKAQVEDIYRGNITNWKEVQGEAKTIKAYQRPENSGSQTGFLDLVLPAEELMKAPTDTVVAGMGELVDAVAEYKNEEEAIGYSYYYYVTDMWNNDAVKLLSIDGVYPDKETISDGSYPYQTAYYAVLRADEPKDSTTRKLLDWILSEEGQRTAEEAGYVKLGKTE